MKLPYLFSHTNSNFGKTKITNKQTKNGGSNNSFSKRPKFEQKKKKKQENTREETMNESKVSYFSLFKMNDDMSGESQP